MATSKHSQIATSAIQPDKKTKQNVDQQGTGGKERNKDVFEFGMDWMEGVDIFQSECLAV